MSGILDLLQSGIYGIGDAAQRTYQGILNNPAVDRWRMGVGERMTGLLNNPAAFMRDAISEGIGFKANVPADLISQVKRGNSQLTEEQKNNLLNLGLAGITVWHGSPHKFNKFDSSKIGTGEGAQAYGHGLYVAENPKVAQDYAVTLSAKQGNVGGSVGNRPIYDAYKALEAQANRTPAAQAGPMYNKLDLLERLGMNELPDDVFKYAKDAYGANSPEVAWLQKEIMPKYKGAGNLYKVDLPDELVPKMLDWDKPLSQQPESVRKAVDAFVKSPEGMAAAKEYHGYKPGMTLLDLPSWGKDPSGQTIYKVMFGSGDVAANALKQSGIPGIRYLDGGSRGSGQGTYNYVVFPGMEDQLKILERQ